MNDQQQNRNRNIRTALTIAGAFVVLFPIRRWAHSSGEAMLAETVTRADIWTWLIANLLFITALTGGLAATVLAWVWPERPKWLVWTALVTLISGYAFVGVGVLRFAERAN